AAEIVLGLRPGARTPVRRIASQRLAIGVGGLAHRVLFAVALEDPAVDEAETLLRRGPFDGLLLKGARRERRLGRLQRFLVARRSLIAVAEPHQRHTEIMLRARPVARVRLGGKCGDRLRVLRDRLLQRGRAALVLGEIEQGVAKRRLRQGPRAGIAVFGQRGQRLAQRRRALLEPGRGTLALAENDERVADLELKLAPFGRRGFARNRPELRTKLREPRLQRGGRDYRRGWRGGRRLRL